MGLEMVMVLIWAPLLGLRVHMWCMQGVGDKVQGARNFYLQSEDAVARRPFATQDLFHQRSYEARKKARG